VSNVRSNKSQAEPSATAARHGRRLVAQADAMLTEAASAQSVPERFRLAHLAALRAAAGLFAAAARPPRRRGPVNAWALVRSIAPELARHADYFAASAAMRAAVEAGAVSAISAADAVRELAAAARFLADVEESVGRLAPSPASWPARVAAG
jgi:SAV_6107-like HEPN